MQAVNILTALCYMGNTEQMGVFATEESPKNEIASMFGYEGSDILMIDGEVKPFTNYLYSYENRLTQPKYGEIGADAVVSSYEDDRTVRIYLYVIE